MQNEAIEVGVFERVRTPLSHDPLTPDSPRRDGQVQHRKGRPFDLLTSLTYTNLHTGDCALHQEDRMTQFLLQRSAMNPSLTICSSTSGKAQPGTASLGVTSEALSLTVGFTLSALMKPLH